MITIKEINSKIKQVSDMNYDTLKEFRNDLIYLNNYGNLKDKQKEQLYNLLVKIFKIIKTFDEFSTDPDFHKELRDENYKVKRESNNKPKQSHNYNIVFETEEQSAKELNDQSIIYTIVNNINGKTYVSYITHSKDGIAKMMNNLDCAENCKELSANKEMVNEWKQYGSNNFTLYIKKVVDARLTKMEKNNLIAEYKSQYIPLYNKR